MIDVKRFERKSFWIFIGIGSLIGAIVSSFVIIPKLQNKLNLKSNGIVTEGVVTKTNISHLIWGFKEYSVYYEFYPSLPDKHDKLNGKSRTNKEDFELYELIRNIPVTYSRDKHTKSEVGNLPEESYSRIFSVFTVDIIIIVGGIMVFLWSMIMVRNIIKQKRKRQL